MIVTGRAYRGFGTAGETCLPTHGSCDPRGETSVWRTPCEFPVPVGCAGPMVSPEPSPASLPKALPPWFVTAVVALGTAFVVSGSIVFARRFARL